MTYAKTSAVLVGLPSKGEADPSPKHGFSAFVFVYTRPQAEESELVDRLSSLGQVEEIHLVDQDDCLLLKVAARDRQGLARFLQEVTSSCPGVERTRTISILRTLKSRPRLVIA